MMITNDWLKHFEAAAETPFGLSIDRMILMLGMLAVGMLLIAIVGLLSSRRRSRRYPNDNGYVDTTTYDYDDGSWLDLGSWFSSDGGSSDWGSSWFSGDSGSSWDSGDSSSD